MANTADCAMRIATKDLDAFKSIMRIVSADTKNKEVYEYYYSRQNGVGQEDKYKCLVDVTGLYGRLRVPIKRILEAYKQENGSWHRMAIKDLPKKVEERGSEVVIDALYETTEIKVWEEVTPIGSYPYDKEGDALLIDFTKIMELANGDVPRIMEVSSVNMGKDLLEINFFAKWDFPEPLERVMNKLAIGGDGTVIAEWQGAVAEPGMQVATDELGTSDLGLVIAYEAVCPDCYNTIEECNTESEAEQVTCPDCKDEKGQPTYCFAQPYTSSCIELGSKKKGEK